LGQIRAIWGQFRDFLGQILSIWDQNLAILGQLRAILGQIRAILGLFFGEKFRRAVFIVFFCFQLKFDFFLPGLGLPSLYVSFQNSGFEIIEPQSTYT
jgi:small basic protein